MVHSAILVIIYDTVRPCAIVLSEERGKLVFLEEN